MAALDESNRAAVWKEFMAEISNLREPCPSTKAQVREVVDALDNYFDANAGAINSAIPQPQRGAMSAKIKSLIAVYVISRRYIVS